MKIKLLIITMAFPLSLLAQKQGAKMVTELGYDNCIELSNQNTRVVLEPNAGGRVLVYAHKNVNVLYINPLQNGWTTAISAKPPGNHLSAGRYDIGPSKIKPNTDSFFFGKWEAKITGNRSAQMSKTDSILGLKIIRTFKLDDESSHLKFTQTVINISNETKQLSSWSRTFLQGGGICVLPVSNNSRFPKAYITYNDRKLIDTEPVEENIQRSDNLLIIKDAPTRPKLEMDCSEGWIAYLMQNNKLFVKQFPIFKIEFMGK